MPKSKITKPKRSVQNSQNALSLIAGALILFFLAATAGYYWKMQQYAFKDSTNPYNSNPSAKACPEDARLCPDGSSVVRVGPYCDFELCPLPDSSPSDQTTSKIKVPFWYSSNKSIGLMYQTNDKSLYGVFDSAKNRDECESFFKQNPKFIGLTALPLEDACLERSYSVYIGRQNSNELVNGLYEPKDYTDVQGRNWIYDLMEVEGNYRVTAFMSIESEPTSVVILYTRISNAPYGIQQLEEIAKQTLDGFKSN
jgi:hypothetical protein